MFKAQDLITLCSGPFWHFVPMLKGMSRNETRSQCFFNNKFFFFLIIINYHFFFFFFFFFYLAT